MAIAGIFVVTIAVFDFLARIAPVGMLPAPSPQIVDQGDDGAILGYLREPDLEEMIDVARDEGFRLHGRPKFRRIDSGAVMAHPRSLFGQPRRERRVARRDHRPAVDENLRADLLGDGPAIGRD